MNAVDCNLGDRLYGIIDTVKKTLPLIITVFSVFYFAITYRFFWLASYSVTANPNMNTSSTMKNILSPELIFIIRVCLFYFIPIFMFTVLLYLIFVTWKKFKIGAGNYSIEMEAENALSIVGRESSAIVEESLRNLDYQYSIVTKFNQDILNNQYSIEKIFEVFVLHMKEIFNNRFYKLEFALNFIPRKRNKLILLNLYGLKTVQNEEMTQIIIESAEGESCFYLELDQVDSTVYKHLIASPIFDGEGEVFSVILVLSKYDNILTEADTYLVEILCQMFSLALSKYNMTLKTEKSINNFIEKIYKFRIEN